MPPVFLNRAILLEAVEVWNSTARLPVTGFLFHLFYKQIHEKIFSAALVGGFDRHIGGFGDISTGGTSEFNQLYIMEELPEEVLIPARGLGLDFSDQ